MLILGIVCVHLFVVYRGVLQWYEQYGDRAGDTYPDSLLRVPVVLLVGAILGMLSRLWAQVLALAISGWILYNLGYLGLYSVAQAHDLPFWSYEVLRRWFAQKYLGHPAEFLQLGLAFIILFCTSLTLLRELHAHNRAEAKSR